MTLGAESTRIQQDIARNRDAVDGAADVDVRKVERLSIEGDETLGTDLPDVGPEIREQLALVRLAVRAGALQLEPMHTDTDDPARARIERQSLENFLTIFVSPHVQ